VTEKLFFLLVVWVFLSGVYYMTQCILFIIEKNLYDVTKWGEDD